MEVPGVGSEGEDEKSYEYYSKDLNPRSFRMLKKEGRKKESSDGGAEGIQGEIEEIAFLFDVIPPTPKGLDALSSLCNFIRRAGGEICYPEHPNREKYALRLLDEEALIRWPEIDCDVPPDTYSSSMIYYMIGRYKKGLEVQDLAAFRLTASQYSDYDPLKILQQTISWEELERSKTVSTDDVYMAQEILLALNDDSECEIENCKYRSTKSDMNEGNSAAPPPSNAKQSDQPRPSSTHSKSAVQDPTREAEPTTTTASINSKTSVCAVVEVTSGDEQHAITPPPLSPSKIVLVPSPLSKEPAILKRPALTTKAVAGPSPKRQNSKQVRKEDQGTSARAEGEWVDCGEQSEEQLDLTWKTLNDDNDANGGGGREKTPGESSDVDDVPYDSSEESSRRGRGRPRKTFNYKTERIVYDRAVTRSNYRKPYSSREDKLIVQMICEQHAFEYTKGAKMWMLMEQSTEFAGVRTWQSLKNRWLRSIFPSIENRSKLTFLNYTISKEYRQRILQGDKASTDGKCPDFTF